MGLLDVSGRLGDTLKLHDYYVTLEGAKLVQHSHPKYLFLVLDLKAEERRVVTRKLGYPKLDYSSQAILLRDWSGHYFDPDALYYHQTDVEEGDFIFEVGKRQRRAVFEISEAQDTDFFGTFGRCATWKINLTELA
ncbi:hypothetical protein [Streptomyces roseoverticillatus]|uniref:Uncharacterized protein n=1 Tax=Streptomyces roseoverticillatus TaxID=66429 RepID=A0ABV3J606_9ACTN